MALDAKLNDKVSYTTKRKNIITKIVTRLTKLKLTRKEAGEQMA